MRKRIRWSANLAYAVGLIATDGCLSKDGRHIVLVSKDLEQLENFKLALRLKVGIGIHSSGNGYGKGKKYYHVQFGDVILYRFLLKIGLTFRKTMTLGVLDIPDQYFSDFLRGHLDGDGCTYSYWDPRWKSSYLFYTTFISVSPEHIQWLRERIKTLYKIPGKIKSSKLRSGNLMYQLVFAKTSSVKLISVLYSKRNCIYLNRKKLKIDQALCIISQQAAVAKLVYA